VDTEEHSTRIFGTDLRTAEVLPLHLIVRNAGTHEFEINAAQIFGITTGGEFAGAYTLHQASQRVRESSIGTTAATGLAVGALAGAAAGAAIGAAAAGGEGAATGAAVGGAVGGVGGVAEGTSDTITSRFKRELAAQDFGDRVIAPGNIEHGFVYLTWQPYTSVRIKAFDITTNKVHEVQLPITVRRP
jgi:phage tail tape-measure protein